MIIIKSMNIRGFSCSNAIAITLFKKKRNKAMDIKKSFISLNLLKDTAEMKNSKNESPAITINENNSSSSILTPPFPLSLLYIKILA